MGGFFLSVLDWSEIWALLIPLSVLLFRRKQPKSLYPVIAFLFISLLLNTVIDLIWRAKTSLPHWLQSNNPIYNIVSVARFVCFSYFFIKLSQSSFIFLKKLIPVLALILMIINFGFFENFFNPDSLSGNLLAAEAYLLLIYCMQYYLSALRDDTKAIAGQPDFWVVTGLSIYVVANFFVFLFYIPLLDVTPELSVNMWNVHNVAFIIFCIFITKAFYGPVRNQYSI